MTSSRSTNRWRRRSTSCHSVRNSSRWRSSRHRCTRASFTIHPFFLAIVEQTPSPGRSSKATPAPDFPSSGPMMYAYPLTYHWYHFYSRLIVYFLMISTSILFWSVVYSFFIMWIIFLFFFLYWINLLDDDWIEQYRLDRCRVWTRAPFCCRESATSWKTTRWTLYISGSCTLKESKPRYLSNIDQLFYLFRLLHATIRCTAFGSQLF